MPTPEPVRAQDLREAVREANIESPSPGPRRRAFNGAYLDVLSGKKNPVDSLRELESDINVAKRLQERIGRGEERPDPELGTDIKSLEQLADVIAENQGIERFKTFQPAGAPRPKRERTAADQVAGMSKETKASILARDKQLSETHADYPRSPVEERTQDLARAIRDEKPIAREKPKARPAMANKPQVKGAPTKKAAPAKAAPGPQVAKKAPATKQGRRGVADLTPAERESLVNRDRDLSDRFPEYPRNEDEAEIQRLAQEIRGEKPAPAKKAAPVKASKPAREPGDLDAMTKAELLADPRAEGAKASWNKDQIKAHIRGEKPAPTKRAPAKKAVPAVSPERAQLREEGLDGTNAELEIIADQEGVPRRGRPRNKAALIEAIRVRRRERAEAPTPEPIVQNPAAQRPIAVPDRKQSFDEAWDAKGFEAPQGSANRSLQEIRDDVSSGRITPDEGIRRLETEIQLNSEEMIDMDQALRGDLSPEERESLLAQRKDLGRSIRAQADASKFMRDHFKREPEV
ncbi:MAG: hypothetical protein L0170_05130, partial [Acidobacteria bacterium]|nr:hypothetical protein [Acidobacteriota bacterium]